MIKRLLAILSLAASTAYGAFTPDSCVGSHVVETDWVNKCAFTPVGCDTLLAADVGSCNVVGKITITDIVSLAGCGMVCGSGTGGTLPIWTGCGPSTTLGDSNLSQNACGDVVIVDGMRLQSSAGIGTGCVGSSILFNCNSLCLQSGDRIRNIFNGVVQYNLDSSLGSAVYTNVDLQVMGGRITASDNTCFSGAISLSPECSTGSFSYLIKNANITDNRTSQLADVQGTIAVDSGSICVNELVVGNATEGDMVGSGILICCVVTCDTNIYNANGTLTAARTLTGCGNNLTFTGLGVLCVDAACSSTINVSGACQTLVVGAGCDTATYGCSIVNCTDAFRVAFSGACNAGSHTIGDANDLVTITTPNWSVTSAGVFTGNGSGLTCLPAGCETDPVFTASAANCISSAGSGSVITAGERTAIGTNTTNNTGVVTIHSDVTSAGSGAIITGTERTNLGTAVTHYGTTTGNPHSVTKSDVGLSLVENTALSTWAGSTNITSLGTITVGTLNDGNVSDTLTIGSGGSVDLGAISTTGACAGDVLTYSACTVSWDAPASTKPDATQVTATGQITRTSGTMATATCMSITPAAGSYVAMFSAEVSGVCSSGGAAIGIAVACSCQAHARREIATGCFVCFTALPTSTQAFVTVNGSEAIQGRWSNLGCGTARMRERSLIIIEAQ